MQKTIAIKDGLIKTINTRLVDEMLAKEAAVSPKTLETWKQLGPLTVQRFLELMPTFEGVPLIECDTRFHTWTEKENTKQSDSENTFEHSGLIKIGDGDKPVMHGIVRIVIAGGGLFESQYANGQEHGYSRFI